MEIEGRADVTTTTDKVTWPKTSLTQDDHGSLTAGIMGTQLKIVHN